MLRIWIQHTKNSLVPPWCLAVQWYSWECSGIPSKYYGTFQVTIVLASATLPSLHSSTATVLCSKGCIRELHSQDDVGKIWFQISLILLFSPSILPIFLSGIQPSSLSLSPSALFVQWSLCTSLPLSGLMFSNGGKLKQGSHACRTLTLPPAGLLVRSMHTDEGTRFLVWAAPQHLLHTSDRNQLALHRHTHEIYMQNTETIWVIEVLIHMHKHTHKHRSVYSEGLLHIKCHLQL